MGLSAAKSKTMLSRINSTWTQGSWGGPGRAGVRHTRRWEEFTRHGSSNCREDDKRRSTEALRRCEAGQRWEASSLVPTTHGCPWGRGEMDSPVRAGEAHGYRLTFSRTTCCFCPRPWPCCSTLRVTVTRILGICTTSRFWPRTRISRPPLKHSPGAIHDLTQPAQPQTQIGSFMTHSVNSKEFRVPVPRIPPLPYCENCKERPSRHALAPYLKKLLAGPTEVMLGSAVYLNWPCWSFRSVVPNKTVTGRSVGVGYGLVSQCSCSDCCSKSLSGG